jgi:aspartyl-tRNA(Asn)/glutamyl-tRNA(Gln) amidotransferase subunit B
LLTGAAAVGRRYETVIGLEVHVELATRSKMFCACSTAFGAPPNTQVCPVCLGLPGALPVPNRQALAYALRAALALGCDVDPDCRWDRKNYHYPDLPKGYQITQYARPLARHGRLRFAVGGGEREVGIRRLHVEEDTGKSTHEGVAAAFTGVDLNRAGVPLIEIVSEPDLRGAEEARLYLQALRTLLLYTGVSDVKMEEGSLRCDANISLRPAGSTELGALVEVKNMNSFRSVQRALEYEEQRQAELLDAGERVVRETRHWDERRGITFSSRSKEEAHDYRYFPEPDLGPCALTPGFIEEQRRLLPELPAVRQARYRGLGLSDYDAGVLVADPALAAFYDRMLAAGAAPREAAALLTVELLGRLNARGLTVADPACRVRPEQLAALQGLVAAGTISGKIAKDVLEAMLDTGQDPGAIVAERGLQQIRDEGAVAGAVRAALVAHPQSVADYRAGKRQALGFLVGQVMKATQGKANPALVNELLRRALDGGEV